MNIKHTPFFLLLLPFFFVLHGYSENVHFIGLSDILLLCMVFCLSALFLFIIIYLVFSNNIIKAALLTSYIMSFYLFFGALQDFLFHHVYPLSRFSFLILAFSVLLISLVIYLKKRNTNFYRLTAFLNLLLIIFVAIDIVTIVYFQFFTGNTQSINTPLAQKKNISVEKKPDIYFLLFDEYASSASLKKYYGFDNTLDSFLVKKGFHVQAASQSNYNFTVFSMASMLNLSYIKGLHHNMQVTNKDFNQGYILINDNECVKFLEGQGYEVINYSIFDFKGNLSGIKQSILPVKTRLITDNTFLSKLKSNVYWPAVLKRFHLEKWVKLDVYGQNNANKQLFRLIDSASRRPHTKPAFIYGHFVTPHWPFYYSSDGRLKDAETISKEYISRPPNSYLSNLLYTNHQIKELINTIQANTHNNAVIILMGDHGFRVLKNDPRNFSNLNAVYFPERNYSLLQDSITCVNQFRVIFNSLFNQSFPLLKDSCIYLEEKQ